MRKILLLSFYYPPDLCPGSFRADALVESLCAAAGDDLQIEVITTQPSRYGSFSREAAEIEIQGNVRIVRLQLPAHDGSMLRQSLAFLVFAARVLRQVRGQHYDLVLGTSSRLMTAVLASVVARLKRAVLYLDIRDIFLETISELFASAWMKPLMWGIGWLESLAVKRASKINVVSPAFIEYFSSRYKGLEFSSFSNGIDDIFVDTDFSSDPPPGTTLEILYAGNIGDGQGLHAIIPPLARQLGTRATFRIIGDGGRAGLLREAVADLGNVEVLPPVSRAELLAWYAQADVLFLHLNDLEAFKRVIPSKVFEYAATGKPVLAGVDGYAARFIATEIENAAVFHPLDVEGAVTALESLQPGLSPRSGFIARYSRRAIMDRMSRDILSLLPA